MRKAASICFLLVISGLLIFGGAATSQSASNREVTGGISFTRDNEQGDTVKCWSEFEVQAVSDSTARGWLKYHDTAGLRFRMAVKCVNKLSDQDAIFSGQIISASDTSYLDQWLLIGVHDGGSPGSKGDTIGGEFFSDDPGCENPPTGEPANVDRGNLVVH